MMTLPIGNSVRTWSGRSRKIAGITFVEVMLTVVILSVGLVGLYRSFFAALNYQDHLAVRLYATNLIDGRIATIERDFRSLKDFDIGILSEEVVINNRVITFQYGVNFKSVGTLLSVFELDVVLSWEDRGKIFSISRTAYFSGISSLDASTGRDG
ncbi:MAG: prepilin-type N-terminal cleavage/methylation domain-containing protein [Candidatus Omnitrophota bacterium]